MGLLDKTNPDATRWSVARNALVIGAVGAAAHPGRMIWHDMLREHWPAALPLWSIGCALIGALWERQVGDDDADATDG